MEAIIYTDIGRDSMLTGVNVDATLRLADSISIPVIASGGITNLEDIRQLCAVADHGIVGAITGRAIYEGTLDFAAAQKARGQIKSTIISFDAKSQRREEKFETKTSLYMNLFAPLRLCVKFIQMGLAKRIIPCLDVDNGRVVKGVKFVESRDAGDPVEIARRYDQQGADEITFLDITASSDNPARPWCTWSSRSRSRYSSRSPSAVASARSRTCAACSNAGADKVAINTAAVARPEFVKRRLRTILARSASSSPWTRSRPDRAGGKCSPTAYKATGLMPSSGRGA